MHVHTHTQSARDMYAESKSRHDYLNMMRKSEHRTHTHNAHGIELKHTKAIILIIPMPTFSGEKISNSLTLNYCFVHVCYIFNIHPRTERLAISSDSVDRSSSTNKNAKTTPINHTPARSWWWMEAKWATETSSVSRTSSHPSDYKFNAMRERER